MASAAVGFRHTLLVRCWCLLLLLATSAHGERVAQRLVGGHAKTESGAKSEPAGDEKKTLSQQVAEGKYGLIQTELFVKKPDRPGVLSYEKNPEVPKDDENSLGGLGPDEIWLAEDHLLVLKGGAFHRTVSELPWAPLDDYQAPARPIKIPAQPKVPPPFPVQLKEGGPIQFLGVDNVTRTFNGSYALPPAGVAGAPPFILPAPNQDPTNVTAGRTPYPLPPYADLPGNYPKGDAPGPGTFPFPPPPPLNQSTLDEDDPSIYYPPPYTFYYHKDNTTLVPPGPLVPGIVLPPPPDFFEELTTITAKPTVPTTTTLATTVMEPNEKQSPLSNYYLPYDDKKKTRKQQLPTTLPPATKSYKDYELPPRTTYLLPTTTPSPLRTSVRDQITTTPYPIPVVQVSYNGNEAPRTYLRPTSSPQGNPTVSTIPVVQIPYRENYLPPTAEVPYEKRLRTYLKPTISPTITTTPRTYLKPLNGPAESTPVQVSQQIQKYIRPTAPPQTVLQIPIQNYPRPTASPVKYVPYKPTNAPNYIQQKPRTLISSTVVPLKGYFSSPDVDTNSVQPQAEYYFYEEENTRPPPPKRYSYVQPSNFDRHVQQLRQQIQTYLKPSARPVYEYSFQAANYKPTRPPASEYQHQVLIPQQYSTARPVVNYQGNVPQQYSTARPLNYQESPRFQGNYQEAPPRYQENPRYQETQRYHGNQNPKYQGVVSYQQNPAYQNNQNYQDNQRYQGNQPYYPKQDDRLLDDITKKYFTAFGQKLTTPVTPISLSKDTLVNYRQPRPPQNAHAELLVPEYKPNNGKGPGTFISYQLPGEGAHFYFLTPQLVQQQEPQQSQQKGYYYPKAQQRRLPRRNQR